MLSVPSVRDLRKQCLIQIVFRSVHLQGWSSTNANWSVFSYLRVSLVLVKSPIIITVNLSLLSVRDALLAESLAGVGRVNDFDSVSMCGNQILHR